MYLVALLGAINKKIARRDKSGRISARVPSPETGRDIGVYAGAVYAMKSEESRVRRVDHNLAQDR